jgi:hypothetical protein
MALVGLGTSAYHQCLHSHDQYIFMLFSILLRPSQLYSLYYNHDKTSLYICYTSTQSHPLKELPKTLPSHVVNYILTQVTATRLPGGRIVAFSANVSLL